jgi:2-phosphosulfolactate phosphatase
MRIETYPTYVHAEKSDLEGNTAIVIDLLRATSTITAAIHNGCTQVLPVEEAEDAREKAKKLSGCGQAVTGGESDGVKLPGFDFGNSPLEYGRERIGGKSLVMCTTNGTRAVKKSMAADTVYLGCLNNALAVAEKAAQNGRDTVIVCAGTRLSFSVDDVVAAGGIISRLIRIIPAGDMDDLSCTALWLYEENRRNLKELIAESRPYRTLMRLDAQADIDYCLKEDIYGTVPVCMGEKII